VELLLTPGDKFFDPALKDTPFQKDAVLALKALYADISPQPDHLPFVTAAGMLFLEADDVSQLDFHVLV